MFKLTLNLTLSLTTKYLNKVEQGYSMAKDTKDKENLEMIMLKKIKKFGNSAVIVITRNELENYEAEIGDIVNVSIKFIRTPKDERKD